MADHLIVRQQAAVRTDGDIAEGVQSKFEKVHGMLGFIGGDTHSRHGR